MTLPLSETKRGGDGVDGESMVEALVSAASHVRLLCAADGRLYAQVPVEDRLEIYALKSMAFRDWLVARYLDRKGEVPSAWAVGRILAVLEARARFDCATPAVHVRVGREGEAGGGESYVDVGDESGRTIKIGAAGWSLVEKPPVNFKRPDGLLPLPLPEEGGAGSIELLRTYVNLSEADFYLLVGWMAAALLPEGPYPILVIHGEQGSAKSTLARIARKLIDPQESPLLAAPRSTRDLVVTAVSGWLLAYDNMSVVPNWLSDSLCRLVTGGGFAGRASLPTTNAALCMLSGP